MSPSGQETLQVGAGFRVDLLDVLGDLSGGLATLATPPSEVAAGRAVIVDHSSLALIEEGDVVLAIGISPDNGWPELLRAAVAAQACAVVVRADSGPHLDAFVSDSRRAGMSLVVSSNGITWERLYGLIQASIGSQAWRSADSAEVGVPLGNMFELASTLSHLVGGPTILEDAYFRVIGYSAYTGESDRGRQDAIMTRQIPPPWLAHLRSMGILKRLRTTDDIMRLEHGPFDARPRLITAVRSSDELIGIIWVAEGDSELNDESIARLREGKRLALPHFQRYLSSDRLGSLRSGEFLRILIEGSGSVDTATALQELHLSPDNEYCLIAVHEGSTLRVGRRELLPALLEAYDRQTMVTSIGELVYGIAPVRDESDLSRLKVLAERCVAARPGRPGIGRARAVLSSPRPLASGLVPARDEVRTLFQVADRRTEQYVVVAGWEVEAEVLIHRTESLLSADGRIEYRKVRLVESYDSEHGTELIRTLSTYFATGGSIARTSEKLRVHHTTTRYRLTKILSVSGLDLRDRDESLAAMLHLLASGGGM